jgi:hypothetical protein
MKQKAGMAFDPGRDHEAEIQKHRITVTSRQSAFAKFPIPSWFRLPAQVSGTSAAARRLSRALRRCQPARAPSQTAM